MSVQIASFDSSLIPVTELRWAHQVENPLKNKRKKKPNQPSKQKNTQSKQPQKPTHHFCTSDTEESVVQMLCVCSFELGSHLW